MKVILLIYIIYLSSLNATGFFHKNSDKYLCDYGNCNCREKCIDKIDEIDTDDFNLFIKKIKNIGGDLIIYLQLRSKHNDFDIDLSRSYIILKDKRGNTVSLNGCDISNFHIQSGEAKIFPLVFKGKAYKLKSPYTLYLKIYKVGEITLTDLKLGSESIEY